MFSPEDFFLAFNHFKVNEILIFKWLAIILILLLILLL